MSKDRKETSGCLQPWGVGWKQGVTAYDYGYGHFFFGWWKYSKIDSVDG